MCQVGMITESSTWNWTKYQIGKLVHRSECLEEYLMPRKHCFNVDPHDLLHRLKMVHC